MKTLSRLLGLLILVFLVLGAAHSLIGQDESQIIPPPADVLPGPKAPLEADRGEAPPAPSKTPAAKGDAGPERVRPGHGETLPGDTPPPPGDVAPPPAEIPPPPGEVAPPPAVIPPPPGDMAPPPAEIPPPPDDMPPPPAEIAAPTTSGSNVPPDKNFCFLCHSEPDIWEAETQRFHVPKEQLEEDVHWKAGVNCHDCHGGDHTAGEFRPAHAQAAGFRPLEDIMEEACAHCHKEQRIELFKSVHAKAGPEDARGSGTLLGCNACHGEKVHGMLPVGDSRSPVFLDHQIRTCGECHPEDLETYKHTVHGHGLFKSGLLVTAVCADCHGAHGIFYAADKRSTLHASKVAATCGQCHKYIQQRLWLSVHNGEAGPGSATTDPAPGGRIRQMPSCTSCHQGHYLLDPESADFQLQLVNLCGNCHADLSGRYTMSVHGELTQLGYVAAAQCAECHGAHDIRPVNDPESSLAAGASRLQTCQKCHSYAVANFTNYDPHANYEDAQRYPALHAVHAGMHTLINWGFGLFAIHAFLWFLRSMIHTLLHGRHKTLVTEEMAILKVPPLHRVMYALLLASFLGLVLTGVPLKYSSQSWARSLAESLGGFESSSVWHRFFAVTAVLACVTQLAGGIRHLFQLRSQKVSWKSVVVGPDSLLPRVRDLRDLRKMVLWFLGLGRRPVFERWTYWEKVDYWAFALGATIIGLSGMMLWYPNGFCRFLPGSTLNVAQMVHSELAILLASLLFIVHFFHAHFRPEKFPMDLSVLTGLVSEEHLRKHRPEYFERLRQSGKLDEMRRPAPSSKRLRLVLVAGFSVFSLGLCLLALILLASLGS